MTSEFTAKVRKIGDSLVVIVPEEISKKDGIAEGTLVKLKIKKGRTSSFGMFPELGHWEGHDGDWGHD